MIKNLGPKSILWLNSIGIKSKNDLLKFTYSDIYILLINNKLKPSLNLFYAIEMGLQNKHWRKINNEEKMKIKTEIENIKKYKNY